MESLPYKSSELFTPGEKFGKWQIVRKLFSDDPKNHDYLVIYEDGIVRVRSAQFLRQELCRQNMTDANNKAMRKVQMSKKKQDKQPAKPKSSINPIDEGVIDKFDDALREIIDAPGSYKEKKQQIENQVDRITLGEFLAWFDRELDDEDDLDASENEDELPDQPEND